MSCRKCRATEFQLAVGTEMEKACLSSLVRVLGMQKVWLLLMEERRFIGEQCPAGTLDSKRQMVRDSVQGVREKNTHA